MSMHEMGPLPLGDRNDIQQQLSLKAFRNRLPEEKFLVRDERIDDKGVDVSLEVKVEIRVPRKSGGQEIIHGFTNCRAQGQIKSASKIEQNNDGSVSYSIETSNLNYLLNGQSPIYFLWLAPKDEIRFAWGKDEWQRLDAENPNWKNQKSFTIRFRNILDAKAVETIHERILKEARFFREITEILGRASHSEGFVLRVDPKALECTDPQKVLEWISKKGMMIVSSGYGSKVLEWFALLNMQDRNDPRVNLVVAYAYVSLGRNYQALGNLVEAKIRINKLSLEDIEFLNYLEDFCDFQTGKIKQNEYSLRQSVRIKSMTGVAGASHRLEMLRQERLNSNDRDHRTKLFEEMRLTVSEIENAIDSNDIHKLNARIHLLSAEGDELTGGLTMEFAQMNARAEMGIRIEEFAKFARKRLVDLWDDWGKRMEACIAEATNLCHPLLLADAITAKTTVFQAVLMTQRMQSWAANTLWEPPEAQIRTMMKLVGQALNIYKRAKNTEGETRTKLFLADLFDLLGNGLASKNLAEGAFVIARAMGYFRLESHALEYIDGFTNFKRFQKEVELKRGVDLDFRTAEESDEDVQAIARFTLKTLNLPSERLPFLIRDAESCRMIARERLDFCRYLNMIQELDHTLSPKTCYAIDPPRGCICEKFKYESKIRHKDAATVISVFKNTNCEGCKSRSPKWLYKHCNKN